MSLAIVYRLLSGTMFPRRNYKKKKKRKKKIEDEKYISLAINTS